MKIEEQERIDKVWGEEIWLVNNNLYCAKLLVIDKNAKSSMHYHPEKTETFFCLEGSATLTINGKEHNLAPFLRAKTIEAGEIHGFTTFSGAVLVETSTHHSDDDVVRLVESQKGCEDWE